MNKEHRPADPNANRRSEPKGADRMRKAMASQTAQDGIGSLDALYSLAVEHGASEATAAGFAHTANGAFALLESQVHDEIYRLAALASRPAAMAAPSSPSVGADKLVREYRPSMDTEVLHAWAKEIVGVLAQQSAVVGEAWRWVRDGEVFEEADEGWDASKQEWVRVAPIFVGMEYRRATFLPTRRFDPLATPQGADHE